MPPYRGGAQPLPKRQNKDQKSVSQPYQPNPSRLAAPDPVFLVKIEEIVPNYEIQPPRHLDCQHGIFLPPDRSDALRTRSERLLRFKDGVFQEVAQDDRVRSQMSQSYAAATVFSQAPSTDHLLAVPFDARTRNVSDLHYDWSPLGFDYQTVPNVPTRASLVFIGGNADLPAPIPETWERLIPQPYRYQRTADDGNPEPSSTTFAGLIGRLPLLVALAAFSACPDQLIPTLGTSRTRGGRWVPHNYTAGRIRDRGLVVTIYRDPTNLPRSTDAVLSNLEGGGYGAFYAP